MNLYNVCSSNQSIDIKWQYRTASSFENVQQCRHIFTFGHFHLNSLGTKSWMSIILAGSISDSLVTWRVQSTDWRSWPAQVCWCELVYSSLQSPYLHHQPAGCFLPAKGYLTTKTTRYEPLIKVTTTDISDKCLWSALNNNNNNIQLCNATRLSQDNWNRRWWMLITEQSHRSHSDLVLGM